MRKVSKQNILIYIAAFMVSTFVLCWGVSIVCQPKPLEKIGYFICCDSYKEQELKKESLTLTNQKGIRKVNEYYISPSDSYAYKYFDSVHESVDFYIVNEDFFYVCSYFGITFTKEQLSPLYPKVNDTYLYSKNDRGTGICIFDKEMNINIGSDYFTYCKNEDKKYFLIIPKTSIHSGTLNGQESSICYDVLNGIFK